MAARLQGKIKTMQVSNIKYPFHLFIPQEIRVSNLLVWGHGSIRSENFEQLQERSYEQFEYEAEVFNDVGLAVVMPILPRCWNEKDHDQSVDAQILERPTMLSISNGLYCRPDLKILKMVEWVKKAISKDRESLHEKIIVGGVSAGASMADRFSALYPDIIAGNLLFGPGLFIYPESELGGISLPYPFGSSDIAKINGSRFNREEFLDFPRYIFVGEEEDQDNMGSFNYEVRHHLEHIQDLIQVIGKNPLEITNKYVDYLLEQDAEVVLHVKADTGHKVRKDDIEKGLEVLRSTIK
jgi:hypothetical protein